MKPKNIIVLAAVLVVLCIVATASVTYIILTQEEEPYVDPYVSILEKSTIYASEINLLLNETGVSLATYRETGNVTYLVYAGQYLTVAMNVHLEYYRWFLYNVSKEINDYEIETKIFDNVYTLENQIQLYMIDIVIAQRDLI